MMLTSNEDLVKATTANDNSKIYVYIITLTHIKNVDRLLKPDDLSTKS